MDVNDFIKSKYNYISEQIFRLSPNFVLIVSIQGLIPVGQFFAAFYLPIELFGEIRYLETVFGIVLLICSFGMPTISFRLSSLMQYSQRSIFRSLALRNIYICLIVLLIFIVFRSFISMHIPIESNYTLLLLTAFLAIPATLVRNAVSIYQASSKDAARITKKILLIFSISVALLTYSATYNDARIWFVARSLTEIILLAYLFINFNESSDGKLVVNSRESFLNEGLVLTLSSILRLISDSIPILYLKAFSSPFELSIFGFASLLLKPVGLAFAVLLMHYSPEIMRSIATNRTINVVLGEYKKATGFLILISAIVLSVLVLLISKGIILTEYQESAIVIPILFIDIIPRALLGFTGWILLVQKKYTTIILINALDLLLVPSMLFTLQPQSSFSVSIIALISQLFLAIVCLRELRHTKKIEYL